MLGQGGLRSASSSVMKAKCLMLDVDGVLVAGRPNDGQAWNTDLFKDVGLSPSQLSQYFFQVAWKDILVGRKELLPTLETVLVRLASSVCANDLIAYWFEMDSRIVQTVLSDVRVARNHGLPVYLATNQEHIRADYLMQTLRLCDEVDGIVYSAKAGYKKPDAEFYTFAEQTTGYQPEELILIDDSVTNVEAAKASGWCAVHWTRTERLSAILQRSIA